ncbi:hypothetical protein RYX36_019078 [Vicia faba]
MPMKVVCYTCYSFVRGRVVHFDNNANSQYLGNTLTLPRGEFCAYQKRVASKKWRLDLVGETLSLTPNHGFVFNASNQPVNFKRGYVNTKAQLYATILLYNINPRSHTSTIPVDMACLLYYMIKGWKIYVAQLISNEIQKIAMSGLTHGNKTAMTLGFLGLITGLCRQVWADILDVATKVISSVVHEDYVVWHCVEKLTDEVAPQPHAHAPTTGLVQYYEQ